MSQIALLALPVSLALGVGCAAPGTPTRDDLGEALSAEEGCGDACTVDSSKVGGRFALTERAHGVRGTLVVVDDQTLTLEDFSFDGGGLDVRALVAADRDALRDDAVVLSEDLRRAGGYEDASLSFALPAGLTVDDVGAFSIWCVVVGQSFADATF